MNRAEMLKRLKAGENALELSIEKWQDIVDGTGKHLSRNCALCEVYLCKVGCPVGLLGCIGTPFSDYRNATSKQARREAAVKEVEFLKSLRKGGKTEND